jgi:peptide subunit release factor 1 (eRF1)
MNEVFLRRIGAPLYARFANRPSGEVGIRLFVEVSTAGCRTNINLGVKPMAGSIDSETLERLARFESLEHQVLSVYLNMGPDERGEGTYRLILKDMLRSLERSLDAERSKALREESERVEQFLAISSPTGRGLIIFSCAPAGLWEVHELPVEVGNLAWFAPSPCVKPLARILEEQERYGVVLVDKENARLFTVFLGQIEEQQDVFDLVPGKHKQGGWSQANYQRHHDMHVYLHLKHVVEALVDYEARKPFDRLILSGPSESVPEFRQLLPDSLAGKVAAVISLPMFASPAEVLRETLIVEEEIERAKEEQLVRKLIDSAKQEGGLGVLGLRDTLPALHAGRVRQMVVASGYSAPGFACRQCGYLTITANTACPVCGADMQSISDVVEEAVKLAIEKDASTETVGGPAREALAREGAIGALLRF